MDLNKLSKYLKTEQIRQELSKLFNRSQETVRNWAIIRKLSKYLKNWANYSIYLKELLETEQIFENWAKILRIEQIIL